MPTFIMLTRKDDSKLGSDKVGLADSEGRLAVARRQAGIGWWIHDSVSNGAWDHVDIFEAPNASAALLIATRVSACTGARTEIWPVAEGLEGSGLGEPAGASKFLSQSEYLPSDGDAPDSEVKSRSLPLMLRLRSVVSRARTGLFDAISTMARARAPQQSANI